MSEFFKKYGKTIFISLIPAFFAFLSRSTLLQSMKDKNILGPSFNIEITQQILLIFSVLIVSGYLGITSERYKHKMEKAQKQRDSLLKNDKESFLLVLEKIIGDSNIKSVNVRVWVRKKERFSKFKELRCRLKGKKHPKIFSTKQIGGLTNNHNQNGLSFEVEPQWQGLVGICYDKRGVVCEMDLKNTDKDYNLNDYQRTQLNGTKFWLCAPIFNDQDEVTAVISFDSNIKINITDSTVTDDLLDPITGYCLALHDTVPEIFK